MVPAAGARGVATSTHPVSESRAGKGGSGKMVLSFQNLDELDDLCRRLMGTSI